MVFYILFWKCSADLGSMMLRKLNLSQVWCVNILTRTSLSDLVRYEVHVSQRFFGFLFFYVPLCYLPFPCIFWFSLSLITVDFLITFKGLPFISSLKMETSFAIKNLLQLITEKRVVIQMYPPFWNMCIIGRCILLIVMQFEFRAHSYFLLFCKTLCLNLAICQTYQLTWSSVCNVGTLRSGIIPFIFFQFDCWFSLFKGTLFNNA